MSTQRVKNPKITSHRPLILYVFNCGKRPALLSKGCFNIERVCLWETRVSKPTKDFIVAILSRYVWYMWFVLFLNTPITVQLATIPVHVSEFQWQKLLLFCLLFCYWLRDNSVHCLVYFLGITGNTCRRGSPQGVESFPLGSFLFLLEHITTRMFMMRW